MQSRRTLACIGRTEFGRDRPPVAVGDCKVCGLTLGRLLAQVNLDMALLGSFTSAFVK